MAAPVALVSSLSQWTFHLSSHTFAKTKFLVCVVSKGEDKGEEEVLLQVSFSGNEGFAVCATTHFAHCIFCGRQEKQACESLMGKRFSFSAQGGPTSGKLSPSYLSSKSPRLHHIPPARLQPRHRRHGAARGGEGGGPCVEPTTENHPEGRKNSAESRNLLSFFGSMSRSHRVESHRVLVSIMTAARVTAVCVTW